VGGEFLLKLNINPRPIANKYREGKLQRTLKRELKVPEIANGEGLKRAAASVSSAIGCVAKSWDLWSLIGPAFWSNVFSGVLGHTVQRDCLGGKE